MKETLMTLWCLNEGGNFQSICVFIDDAEDLVRAIPAVIEFVEVGEGMILLESCFVYENEVMDFERRVGVFCECCV